MIGGSPDSFYHHPPDSPPAPVISFRRPCWRSTTPVQVRAFASPGESRVLLPQILRPGRAGSQAATFARFGLGGFSPPPAPRIRRPPLPAPLLHSEWRRGWKPLRSSRLCGYSRRPVWLRLGRAGCFVADAARARRPRSAFSLGSAARVDLGPRGARCYSGIGSVRLTVLPSHTARSVAGS